MINKKLLLLTLPAFMQCALAQLVPGAGSQLQQLSQPPRTERAAPEIRIQQERPQDSRASNQAVQAKIVVNSLRITGATVYPEFELLAVTQFKPGSELTLSDLNAMALKISNLYNSNGYFVAQAYLPAQDIKEGAVTIAVIEGRLGNITLRNSTNLSDSLARSMFDGLRTGDLITLAPIENSLLRLSDLPGVKVNSSLVPGAVFATSDLVVNIEPGQRVTGSVDADNAGNRYTGEYRVGATLNVNNFLGQGDVATLRVLTTGSGLTYARAAYQMQFGRAHAGVAYSQLNYALGREFAPLIAHGTAQVGSLFAGYRLSRTRNSNTGILLNYDDKTFRDRIDSTGAATDKKARVLTGTFYGDLRDSLGGGGASTYAVSLSTGQIDIKTPAALAADAAGPRTNGHFSKLAFNANRLQNLSGPFALFVGINGQVASKNLDVSEQMALGGMNAVRAYPEGEAFADQGYVLTVEGRMLLPRWAEGMPGQMQAVAFVDTGSVRLRTNPFAAAPNARTLSAAGIGLVWSENNNFMVRTYYARKIGTESAMSAPDKSGRFWIQGIKYF